MVVPGTTARRDLPSHIEIEPGDSGLDQVTYAKCEDLKSISEKRLISRLGRVGPDVMFEIGRVLRFLLDL
jgi:mRNA interferase MazF